MVMVEGGRPVTAPGWTGQPRTDIALVDCDIHHKTNKPDDLHPYLPRVYREQTKDYGQRSVGNGYMRALEIVPTETNREPSERTPRRNQSRQRRENPGQQGGFKHGQKRIV